MQNSLIIGELKENFNREKKLKPTCCKFAFSLCSASNTAKIKNYNLYFIIAQKTRDSKVSVWYSTKSRYGTRNG